MLGVIRRTEPHRTAGAQHLRRGAGNRNVYWSVLVPTGRDLVQPGPWWRAARFAGMYTASIRCPECGIASSFTWGVVAPAAPESIAIRLFRFTPTTLRQVSATFTLNAGNFVVSTKIDLTPNLLAAAFDPDDSLACSYVHAGPQQLQPLLAGRTFDPVPTAAALVNPAVQPLVWPPS